MANKDYYELLGVNKNATEQEIKSAYRKKVMQYHPDRYATKSETERKEAEEKIKEINHAYEVLSDATKRSNYDNYGSEEGMQGGFGGGFSGGAGGFGDIFGDIFNQFMGGQGRTSRANMRIDGEDISVRLDLTFEEALFGAEKEIKIMRNEKCPDCGGSGAKDPKSIVECPVCHGTGYTTTVQQTIFGTQTVRGVCRECGGKGKVIKDKCHTCKGAGIIRKERTIPISIPAGIDTNQSLSMGGEGHCGRNGGINGDLYIITNVKPHPLFVRKGSDLYIEVPVTLGDATLGAKISVPTPNKKVSYTLPAGTQNGDVFRLKGYGVKVLRKNAYGDLYVTVNVEIPKALSRKQEQLLKAFEESLGDKEYAQVRSFKSKYLDK